MQTKIKGALVDEFADVKILRYEVPGFESLSLDKKMLIYYLSKAAEEGRDILFDQNNKYNLRVRRIFEALVLAYSGDKNSKDYLAVEEYLKRIWFSNGIHHHYSTDKLPVGFSLAQFQSVLSNVEEDKLPFSKQEIIALIEEQLLDKASNDKRVNQKSGADLIQTSSNNYYGDNLTQPEVEQFYAKLKESTDEDQPVSLGLNSTLVKKDGIIQEECWYADGKYKNSIQKIVYWLREALAFVENDKQEKVIRLLIEFYETGDLKTFDAYNIAWLEDQNSEIDFVNGFIETYGDPLGLKGSWESIVNFKNVEATKRTEIISSNAQWFEDHSPVDEQYKKDKVSGVSAKVITAALIGGDCYPATPIGINLPNSDWIRKQYGSKSVTIENITEAYDEAGKGSGALEEFCYSAEEIERAKKYGFLSSNLHTDLHECLGHGSGQLAKGIHGDELKAYGATIEEARADLFALYYIMDEKMMDLGLFDSMDAAKAEYDAYIRNGLLTQLTRINPGDDLEESHMRNRQLIAKWCFEKGKSKNVIEQLSKGGKTYFVIHDFKAMRALVAELLKEIQRIKSEGDFDAAKQLVEDYAVSVDLELNKEAIQRYKSLGLKPYTGFVNPQYYLVKDASGTVIDVEIKYNESFTQQMFRYAEQNSWE